MIDQIRRAFLAFRGKRPSDLQDVTELVSDEATKDDPRLAETKALVDRAFDLLDREAHEQTAFMILVVDLRDDDVRRALCVDRFSGTLGAKSNFIQLFAGQIGAQLKRLHRFTDPKWPTS